MNQPKKIYNWGKFPVAKAKEWCPTSIKEIQTIVQNQNTILARGNARCYGDAALHSNVISTLRLNHFLDFDTTRGIINCESGVLFSDILEITTPKGFFLPVTPGTKFITIGGALASDVHGKNHHIDGCFSEYVLDFDLIDSRGKVQFCSKTENTELFWSTAGGMGLTGIISRVRLQLKPIETRYIYQESIKAKNLDELFCLFDKSKNYTYSVAWIDCLQKGRNIGRSILKRGEHVKSNELPEKWKNQSKPSQAKSAKTIPFDFPSFFLGTLTVRLFNLLYYHKQIKRIDKSTINYDKFFYPLDSIHNWNRIYGKRGFTQYQFVIPKETGKEGMREILEKISKSKQGSFLAVLKLFGKNNPKAYNAFPMEGYTLALDFKITKALPLLINDLDVLVEKYGGRIYRAKDSLSKSSLTNYVKNIEQKKFNSQQNKRIAKTK